MVLVATEESRLRRWAKRMVRAWLRGLAVFCMATIVIYAMFIAPARARVTGQLMGFGDELLRYKDAQQQDEPRRFFLNGSGMLLSAGSTNRSIDDVLDYYERYCSSNSPQMEEIVEMFNASDTSAPIDDDSDFWNTTLREDNESRGFVTCLAPGGGRTAEQLVARIDAFNESRDIAMLGGFRYVYAKRHKGMTHFILFWSDRATRIDEMFPKEGDAAGSEVPGIVRPPGSRRILTSREQGAPYQMNVYKGGEHSALELKAYYHRALPEQGWEVFEDERQPRAVIAMRGGIMVAVTFRDKRGGVVTTVLTTMAGR